MGRAACACGGDRAPKIRQCRECATAKAAPHVREQAATWRALAVPAELHRARVLAALWPPGRRWCSGCQTFVRLIDCGVGATRCSTCTGAASHAARMKSTYRIHGRPFTATDYDTLFQRQGGRCFICRRPSVTKRLAVDHDHATGQVRGLLCPG